MLAVRVIISRDDDSKQKYESKKNLKFCGKVSVKLIQEDFNLVLQIFSFSDPISKYPPSSSQLAIPEAVVHLDTLLSMFQEQINHTLYILSPQHILNFPTPKGGYSFCLSYHPSQRIPPFFILILSDPLPPRSQICSYQTKIWWYSEWLSVLLGIKLKTFMQPLLLCHEHSSAVSRSLPSGSRHFSPAFVPIDGAQAHNLIYLLLYKRRRHSSPCWLVRAHDCLSSEIPLSQRQLSFMSGQWWEVQMSGHLALIWDNPEGPS